MPRGMRVPIQCGLRAPPRRQSALAVRYAVAHRRNFRIASIPASETRDIGIQSASEPASSTRPDARFEVLGTPSSLLSVSLSASQELFTRRGTLVGVSGKAESALSTLSILQPFRRAVSGIPFLYQKITSTSPIQALIATKSSLTSFTVVHLDGRMDWMVAQRNAILAWTGHTLAIKPKLNTTLSLSHWGNSYVTGRGLLALVGKGQIYQIVLKTGDEYVVHPSNVIAYSISTNPPLPYRFKSSALRLQVPLMSALSWIPDIKFFQVMRETPTWRKVTAALFRLRTWTRRSISGDRLFLRFYGPSTVLVQSRGSSLRDVLTTNEVNEIADTPAGVVRGPVKVDLRKPAVHASAVTPQQKAEVSQPEPSQPLQTRYARVGRDGKVTFN
ncbi:hypothetical protein P152DRAFT_454493 [Eremomyces bilateralis CBS 781.70]|uniref:Altered inheritance of mitochondria protein 24, mitochondrial n=1 Tax=Eremomyces bilateralis CBS 781.70 TaxID=1392243 RepID=A0A6G1GDR8_9PEZI|nr:uncharacterized protein P152DRAFT_454493 [Eremomyces bilateralis CBS 781.70]KAF1816237.1 hypothetical protein P152DRAFT_454493 [Eremomyces bilateralis CBS 781.70]